MATLVKSAAEDEEKAAKQLDAKVVDLEPGDVLYIPPYWFHLTMTPKAPATKANPLLVKTPAQEEATRIEGASKFSSGINIWSEAEELSNVDTFEAVGLPFEDDWPASERRTAVAAYARLFLGSLLRGGGSAAHQGLILMLGEYK